MTLIRTLFAFTLLSACSPGPGRTSIEFWAMGREGEAVQALLPEFERRHPGVRVEVQQIPWSAAHEKLLTAYAGNSLPDLFQLGNTWIPEFVLLRALEPLDDRVAASATLRREDYFPGILASNRIDGRLYGLPWYVDTRLLFYRRDLLARAGLAGPPRNWGEWTEALARIRALPEGRPYGILLPMNEWEVPAILGLQLGAELLREDARYGDFRSPTFRRAFAFYLDLFRQGYAPAVGEAQLANLYQDFARGEFVFYISGPWNIGEFQRRLPEALAGQWTTAPLPGPEGDSPGPSLAGGASLALARTSRHKELAFRFMEFLAEPEQQRAFHRLTGDLPARRSAWAAPDLAGAGPVRAFRIQLERLAPTPAIPEWERIAAKLAHYAERAVRGELSEAEALAGLDRDVDLILEKRRWLLEKKEGSSASPHPGSLPEGEGTDPGARR